MRVIWAYHSEDVGPSGPMYHGVNRGRKSMRLLDPGSKVNISSEIDFFNLQYINVSVTAGEEKVTSLTHYPSLKQT